MTTEPPHDPPERVRVFLNNEVPRFGSGWRLVIVNQIGPTWVHLQYGRKKARISREMWLKLITSTAKHDHRQQAATSKGKVRRSR